MRAEAKDIVWISGSVTTPPLSAKARTKAGVLLRMLQLGASISMPYSRRLPEMCSRCHELRIRDGNSTWRIIYRVDQDVILVVDVFSKKTQRLPRSTMQTCKARLRWYDLQEDQT
jgi:phage-related protein